MIAAHAIGEHLLVPGLEDVERKERARKQHDDRGEQGEAHRRKLTSNRRTV